MSGKGKARPRDGECDCDARSHAALSICESLALALAEEGILTKEGICLAIEDSVAAHREAAELGTDPNVHRRAALLAERIKKSVEAANSKRR